MRKIAVALLVLQLPLAAAHAQTMPVSEFLAKTETLKKKGMGALFSRDYKLLKAQVSNSGKALRAEEAAVRKAGRTPDYCLPKKASFTPAELLGHLNAIPAAQRGMPFKQAFKGFVAKKYPCR